MVEEGATANRRSPRIGGAREETNRPVGRAPLCRADAGEEVDAVGAEAAVAVDWAVLRCFSSSPPSSFTSSYAASIAAVSRAFASLPRPSSIR